MRRIRWKGSEEDSFPTTPHVDRFFSFFLPPSLRPVAGTYICEQSDITAFLCFLSPFSLRLSERNVYNNQSQRLKTLKLFKGDDVLLAVLAVEKRAVGLHLGCRLLFQKAQEVAGQPDRHLLLRRFASFRFLSLSSFFRFFYFPSVGI